MKKYLVLYRSSVPAAEQMAAATPEQAKAGIDAWMAWAKRAAPAIVDLGGPIGSPVKIGPGSTAPQRGHLGGYSILQAESTKILTELLAIHPHLATPGASIELHEFLPMPGSDAGIEPYAAL
jgi:hypothetical protein